MQFTQWLPRIRVVTIEGSAVESIGGNGRILYVWVMPSLVFRWFPLFEFSLFDT